MKMKTVCRFERFELLVTMLSNVKLPSLLIDGQLVVTEIAYGVLPRPNKFTR